MDMWNFKGQEHIYKLIQNSIATKRISHAYLLLGPEHIGKSTLALEITKYIHCLEPEKPCQNCMHCLRILEKTHPDVITLGNSIKDVRELKQQVSLTPFLSTQKTIILNQADKLTLEASNALLKVLEEPPDNVTFILCALDEQYLPGTIISRCQKLELFPLDETKIYDYLNDNYNLSSAEASIITKLSNGRLGWAIKACTDTNVMQTRNLDISLLIEIIEGDMSERFLISQQLTNNYNKSKESIYSTFETWISYLRDLILLKNDAKELIINIDHHDELSKSEKQFELLTIIDSIKEIDKAAQNLSKNGNPRITLDNLLIRFP